MFVTVVMTASAATAEARISDCATPLGSVRVVLPSGLPPALKDLLGDVAMPGEPFDSTDVYLRGHKHRRYIFVWNRGTRWTVAMEQGGIALLSAIYVYELGKEGKKATLVQERTGLLNEVCTAATKLSTP